MGTAARAGRPAEWVPQVVRRGFLRADSLQLARPLLLVQAEDWKFTGPAAGPRCYFIRQLHWV